jgi:hypothetical protein
MSFVIVQHLDPQITNEGDNKAEGRASKTKRNQIQFRGQEKRGRDQT